ncbi:MAG: T9SS type A sorting domain-containing protein [Candidatus Zixiibacteriota bacterium]
MKTLIRVLYVPTMFALLVSTASAFEMAYRETIDQDGIVRQTWSPDDDGNIWWSDTISAGFGELSPTTFLNFWHSIDDIEPPILPNGMILSAHLEFVICTDIEDHDGHGDGHGGRDGHHKKHGDKHKGGKGKHHDDEDNGHHCTKNAEHITLTLDSVDIGEFHERLFIVGPDPDDSISVTQSSLSDGLLEVRLSSDDDPFLLRQSVLEIRYQPALPTDIRIIDGATPDGFTVSDNYPNPFNPSTTIEYSLPNRAFVVLKVYDLLGRTVNTLISETQSAGSYAIDWDGTDIEGNTVASGMYFYRLETDNYSIAKKMLLLK